MVFTIGSQSDQNHDWDAKFASQPDPLLLPPKGRKGAALILSSFFPWLPRAATRGAQLIATTSSPKRRKVSPEPRTSPGLRARRHGRSEPPHSRHTSSSSRRGQSPSLSPPRYVPAHLQFQTGSPPGRSLTPATATAGLTLHSDISDMPSDTREGTPPTNGRSPSPGEKRPASEITDSDPEGGVSTTAFASNARNENIPRTSDAASDIYPTPSSNGNAGSSLSDDEKSTPGSPDPKGIPTVDEQVAEVNALMQTPLKDGQKGYVVSMNWLKKVLARTTAHADHNDKESLEADVGPVNNLNIMLDTDQALPSVKDETGELFVPMRPGLHEALDFTVIPQHGWQLIQKWYGLADQSPVIIRYAHNINQPGETENIEYENYPPIFTVFKLANPAAGTTPATLRETNKPSVKVLASRYTSYQKWLRDAKEQAGIDMATKVRVWNILQLPRSTNASASATPAASRTQSPAPPLALISNPNDKLLFDLNAFLELSEGSHRVLLANVKDQTQNANYNGRMTLNMAGLGTANCVILEEQVGGSKGGEWISEVSAKTLKSLGIPVDTMKKDALTKVTAPKAAIKSAQSSGKLTPALPNDPIRGLITRGRKGRQLVVGLQNLGNTCYMNSALQCVRSIEELSYYFLSEMYKRELNPTNVLGCGGVIAKQWANLLQELYKSDPQPRSVNPSRFRSAAGRQREEFAGFEQHDSQEFVMFLLDALSEDLSRIVGSKPATTIPDSTDEMINDRKALEAFGKTCWDLYESRNASVITDLFAGMYKSTLICPTCEKTSIIMDPFTMVTVPIPSGPNLVNRTIIFLPLDGPPVSLRVRLDENETLKFWKNFVAQKMGIEGERIFAAETLHHSFWQTFEADDDSFGSLRTRPDDTIVFVDMGPLPTSTKSSQPISANDDGIIVPVFHRKLAPQKKREDSRDLFGMPSFIRLSSEEAQDLEAIYRKLLAQANNMTTRDILSTEENSADEQRTDDSDTVVTNEDDARSADSRIKTSSVDGEDSIVDISMQTTDDSTPAEDAEESDSDSGSTRSPQHPLAGKITANLLSLFDAKVMSTNTHVPDGRNISSTKNYPLLSSRIASPTVSTKTLDAASKTSADDNSDDYFDTDGSDTESTSPLPLLRQGDAILIDWTADAADALFGGKPRDPNELRGRPSYLNIKSVFDFNLAPTPKKLKKSVYSLDECLDEFSKEEILSQADSWYCPQCKTHVSATKKFELWRTPDILVVQLKRFSQFRGRLYGNKINTVIDFPLEGLDLSSRVQGPTDGKSAVYDLIAVDNHMGGLGGGHYTAYIKDFVSGAWVYCNDTSARTVTDLDSIISAGAYLLFYRRRSDRALGNQELQELVESYRDNSSSDSAGSSASRSAHGSQSPDDGGRRLGGPAPLARAKVAPRVCKGQDSLGNDIYSSAEESTSDSEDGGSSGKKIDFEHETGGSQVESLSKLTEPSWSFDDAHADSQITSGNSATEDGHLDGHVPWGDPMDIDQPFQFGLTSGGGGGFLR
ncbi:Peptidase C19 ubiquitin carboxyl-terminal hydrolase 2 [Penicillium paradoxum]|uniref:Peptidase C19 ubiquitin carboxyl-terminal hydrolase 2 n=1 Tax=Penicillium paradoxum TaxID=176176 RepID=UPI002549514A|nr:Peptidase C19 ubiquitin carboxyl-terminal hydrolase 2 [Penicillium paradoxum]KAJ5773808.1 Peptidase C19 ubiquitin carboxyl-terminal hydrolase 2 [Penicillium paradoxum]